MGEPRLEPVEHAGERRDDQRAPRAPAGGLARASPRGPRARSARPTPISAATRATPSSERERRAAPGSPATMPSRMRMTPRPARALGAQDRRGRLGGRRARRARARRPSPGARGRRRVRRRSAPPRRPGLRGHQPVVHAAPGHQLGVGAALRHAARRPAPGCGRRRSRSTAGGRRSAWCGPRISRSSASWMAASLSASTDESASSRIRIGRVAEQRAGDRDALPLPAGEPHAALADHRAVALGQAPR